MRRTNRRLTWWAGLSVLLLVLTACGDTDDDAGQAETTPEQTQPETTETEAETESPTATAETEETAAGTDTVRVTTLYVCSEAHLAWGMEKGVFEEHGVDVELVRTAGGAAGLAAIVAGEADLSSTNPASAILAFNQGFPVRIVSGSFESNPEAEGFNEGVVVRADSEIQGPEDLAGTKLAVNELGSQNHIFAQAWLRDAGVTPTDVNIIALPFPQLVPALQDGRIDAALLTGSQVAQMVGPGDGRKIGNPLSDVIGPVPIATYMSTVEFLEANQDTVDRFVTALNAAIEELEDPANREEALQVMSNFCEAPVDALRGVAFVDWNAFVELGTMTEIVDVLVQEGSIREPIDPAELVAETAQQ